MKKVLLDSNKNYYKANLHCHTTVSDGRKTPQEVKDMYKEHGYSVVAFTDHDVLIPHPELADKNFLPLNGYEMEIAESGDLAPNEKKNCHLCFVALAPDNLTQVCWHRNNYLFANAVNCKHLVRFDETKPDFVREYTPKCINRIIKEGRDNGFFVTYNHPVWSFETFEEYGKYHGMNAMEIFNFGSAYWGYPEYNERVYDEILRGGERIYCISTDDNHFGPDSFGGFIMINAEKLEYKTITGALANGEFYASQGPEIYELWYENGKIGIECEPCAKIAMCTGIRATDVRYPEGDKPLTSAVFDVIEGCKYFRLTVTDSSGKHANTSAYFIDELE